MEENKDSLIRRVKMALDSIYPSSGEKNEKVLKTYTRILEDDKHNMTEEQASMIRGEIRKAMIVLKNRPYYYDLRLKLEKILNTPEAIETFIHLPKIFTKLHGLKINDSELVEIKEALLGSNMLESKINNIPYPSIE